MMLWLTLIPVLSLALGIALLVRGLRGRRMDDHPICRRCGFDLTGRPQGSDHCAECGADLTRPHAIRDGHRVRRRGLIAAGSFLILFVLANAIFAAWVVSPQVRWREYAPVWYLRDEARSADPSTRDAALNELFRRMIHSPPMLSQAQIDALVDDALKVQADKNRAWLPAWGVVVETALDQHKLSAERLDRYLDAAVKSALSLKLRPEIERGRPIEFTISSSRARVGGMSRINLQLRLAAVSADVGPVHLARHNILSGSLALSPYGGAGIGSLEVVPPDQSEMLKDGPNEFVLHLDLKVMRDGADPPLHTAEVDLKAAFTLVPAGVARVKINRDASLRPAMQKAIGATLTYGKPWNANWLGVELHLGAIPAGVGFDVFAKIDGREVKLGRFAHAGPMPPKGSATYSTGTPVPPPFDQTAVDVILRPSKDAALDTIDTFEIWDDGSDVVLKKVPVKRTPPTATSSMTSPASSNPSAHRLPPARTSTARD